jgi:hypothetical protein
LLTLVRITLRMSRARQNITARRLHSKVSQRGLTVPNAPARYRLSDIS